MKREKFIPKNIIDEDVPAFMGALAQAAKAGKKDFKFGDKTYKVKLKKDVADKITKNMGESKDFEPHMMYDPKTGKEYKAEKPEDHMKMKKMGYSHEKPEMKSEATTSDYMRLSDKELDELLKIFKNVGRSTSKTVMKALSLEKKRRFTKEDKKQKMINDKKTVSVAEAVKKVLKRKEESNAFTAAAAEAKLAGKKEFEFEGKKYPVKIKDDVAKKITEVNADYQLYHPTFTAAAKAASDLAKKKGFEVDEDDWFNQVSTGPKKPGKGKTNRYVVKVTKKGKETKKRLAFQVYGMDSGKYELNAYVESTQIQEVNESTMDKVNAIVSDKQAAKIGGKMIDMQTASAIVQVYSKVNAATKKKMENEKIEKLVSIAQRVMAKESTNLEEASATVAMVLKALRLKGGKDADALIKKMKDLDLESKVSKAHADAAKKILKGQITKFVKESDKELDIKSLKD